MLGIFGLIKINTVLQSTKLRLFLELKVIRQIKTIS